MQVFVEIWYRRKRDSAYRHHGIEQVAALLEAGMPMMLTVDGCERRVTVDKAERTGSGMPVAGRLWVTEA
jgi:hypothetical protein